MDKQLQNIKSRQRKLSNQNIPAIKQKLLSRPKQFISTTTAVQTMGQKQYIMLNSNNSNKQTLRIIGTIKNNRTKSAIKKTNQIKHVSSAERTVNQANTGGTALL